MTHHRRLVDALNDDGKKEKESTMKTDRKKSRRPFLVGATLVLTFFSVIRVISLPRDGRIFQVMTGSREQNTRKAILFMHTHKSGGTGVCQTMRLHQNQVNITDMLGHQDKNKIANNNCNTELTTPHLNDNGFHAVQTCRMLELYTTDISTGILFQRNNFIGVEIPLHDELPCAGFRSLALMRKPMSRVLSHLQFHRYSERTVTQWLNRPNINYSKYKDYFLYGYHSINNMVVRQLLGRKRYIDPRPIDEADYNRAKSRVDLFDAFVPLEYIHHEKVLQLLQRTIPEYHEGLMNSNNLVVNKRHENNTLEYSQEFLVRLAKENRYDTELYKYVLKKLGIDDENGE